MGWSTCFSPGRKYCWERARRWNPPRLAFSEGEDEKNERDASSILTTISRGTKLLRSETYLFRESLEIHNSAAFSRLWMVFMFFPPDERDDGRLHARVEAVTVPGHAETP